MISLSFHSFPSLSSPPRRRSFPAPPPIRRTVSLLPIRAQHLHHAKNNFNFITINLSVNLQVLSPERPVIGSKIPPKPVMAVDTEEKQAETKSHGKEESHEGKHPLPEAFVTRILDIGKVALRVALLLAILILTAPWVVLMAFYVKAKKGKKDKN